jgi:hypothetical protein
MSFVYSDFLDYSPSYLPDKEDSHRSLQVHRHLYRYLLEFGFRKLLLTL